MKSAIILTTDTHARFARVGATRLRRQALQSDGRRRALLRHGAVSVLVKATNHSSAEVRDMALDALSVFAHGAVRDAAAHPATDAMELSENINRPACQLLRFPGVAAALVDNDCRTGCHSLWRVVVTSDRSDSRQQRIEQLRHAIEQPN